MSQRDRMRMALSTLAALSLCTGACSAGESFWDHRFSPPPDGLGLDGPVLAIATTGQNVYVAGEFTHAGSITAHRVAKWDGTNWSALGSGHTFDNGYIYCIA